MMNNEYPDKIVFENQVNAHLCLMLFAFVFFGLLLLAAFDVFVIVDSLGSEEMGPLIAFLCVVALLMYITVTAILNVRDHVEMSVNIQESILIGGVRTYRYDDISSIKVRQGISHAGAVRVNLRINNGDTLALETNDFTIDQIEAFLGGRMHDSKMKVIPC